MADHQRIYPDAEAPAAAADAALVPTGASKSDKGDPADYHHQGQYPPFPPRTIPVTYSRPPPIRRKRSCLCRCLCWTVSLILIQIIVVAITAGIIFLVFRPKLPKFTVDQLQVTQFNLNADQSLSATFDVSITARNPNKKIGIYYEGGSSMSVWYTGTNLCEGGLPKFYQGHRNTTQLVVLLTGQNPDASGLLNTLQQQKNVPLTLRVRQPVRIKLGGLKLPKVKFLVRCRLLVDSLSANNDTRIQSSSCKFRFRL